jgi:hypothetical protein
MLKSVCMHASVHDVDTSSACARTRCCLMCAQWRLGLLGTHAACRQCLCVCAHCAALSKQDSCQWRILAAPWLVHLYAHVSFACVCLCVRNGLYAWRRRLVLRACSICAHEGSLPVCAWCRLPVRACACVMACTCGVVNSSCVPAVSVRVTAACLCAQGVVCLCVPVRA